MLSAKDLKREEGGPVKENSFAAEWLFGHMMHAGKLQGLLVYGREMLRNFPMTAMLKCIG